MELLQLSVKMLVGFIGLLVLTRFLGKKALSDATPFDFIYSLILGEIVGNAIYDEKVPAWHIVFALGLWGVLLYVTEKAAEYSQKMRRLLKGEPSVLIHAGEIDIRQMEKDNLEMEQLLDMLRPLGIFSVREVEYAVLETAGKLSVLKKTSTDTPERRDLGLPAGPVHRSYMLIDEGDVIEKQLQEIGRDRKWLEEELSRKGITSLKEVYYADWKADEGLFIKKYE